MINQAGYEAEKGDTQRTYKGIYGYQPVVGIISENSMVVGSDFREGNFSPQSGLVEFIESCRKNYPQQIQILRSDSAGWQKEVVDYCNREGKKIGFTISADQNTSVLEAVKSIPEEKWSDAVAEDGINPNHALENRNEGSKSRRF